MTRLLITPAVQHLKRTRLLRRLPDSAGYAVWLQAPYGYGKSVLASQWATELEAEGWRVLWLSLMGEDLRGLLARELNLPPDAPWLILLDHLWSEPTLLVLEELEGRENLTPVLRDLRGLILLASRQPLPEPELPRLRSGGQLIHLRAADLCFTLTEAQQLFADPVQAERQWERARGWPLPLKLAALTGSTGDDQDHAALLRGMCESLSPAGWQEALLLSTLNGLPSELASDHTHALADAGFVQALEGGYRLHPFLAEQILTLYRPEVQQVLQDEAKRLPILLRGKAYQLAQMPAELNDLLETQRIPRSDFEALVDWDRWLSQEMGGKNCGLGRSVKVGEALCLMGQHTEGLARLQGVLNGTDAPLSLRFRACREIIWHQCSLDPQAALPYVQLGQEMYPEGTPDDQVNFLNYAQRVHFMLGDYDQSEALLLRALETLPPESTVMGRRGLLQNLSVVRWYRDGDLEGQTHLLEDLLHSTQTLSADDPQQMTPLQASVIHWNLGVAYHLLSEREKALEHFTQVQQHAKVRPLLALQAKAMQAIVLGQFAELPALMTQLQVWESRDAEDRISAWWATALLARGDAQAALKCLHLDTPWAKTVRARALHQAGRKAEALAALPAEPDAVQARYEAMYWHAAQYLLHGRAESLDTLLSLTTSKTKLLPALIPLAQLPRDRPELAAHYPLEEVLNSGWKAALQARLPDMPPLEVTTLGRFEVKVLGKPVTLTQRPREILLLLLLGKNREQIATELWPELEPAAVRNNLNFNFSALRKALEPWGVPTYLYESGLQRVKSDLDDLESALTRHDPEAALALYSGELAPETDLPSVQETRADLHGRVIKLLEGGAAQHPARAEAYLERVLELEPLSEDALASLAAVLEGQGRHKQAQRLRQEFAARLIGEGLGFSD